MPSTKHKRLEIAAVLATVAGIALAVAVPLRVESARTVAVRDGTGSEPVREIVLTAVMAQGVWTDAPVTAAAPWRRDFPAARLVLRAGEPVRLRLRSADVVHAFSLPELGVEPVDVVPGKETVVEITPDRAGTFGYYCTTVCGDTHFAMRGEVVVLGPDEDGGDTVPPESTTGRPEPYWTAPEPSADAALVERGAWLFRQKGCITCHGEEGRGGVDNPNGMNPTVPALADMSSKLLLFEPEDVEAFVALLESGRDVETGSAPEIPLFDAVRKQYSTFRRVIREGRPAAPLDPVGPTPPLRMPRWKHHLTGEEIDAILAYLSTLDEPTSESERSTETRTDLARSGPSRS